MQSQARFGKGGSDLHPRVLRKWWYSVAKRTWGKIMDCATFLTLLDSCSGMVTNSGLGISRRLRLVINPLFMFCGCEPDAPMPARNFKAVRSASPLLWFSRSSSAADAGEPLDGDCHCKSRFPSPVNCDCTCQLHGVIARNTAPGAKLKALVDQLQTKARTYLLHGLRADPAPGPHTQQDRGEFAFTLRRSRPRPLQPLLDADHCKTVC